MMHDAIPFEYLKFQNVDDRQVGWLKSSLGPQSTYRNPLLLSSAWQNVASASCSGVFPALFF